MATPSPFSPHLARTVHDALDLGGLFWVSDWNWAAVLAEAITTTRAVPNADEWADFVAHLADHHHISNVVDECDPEHLDEWEDDRAAGEAEAKRFFADRGVSAKGAAA